MSENSALKDHINRNSIRKLGRQFYEVFPEFPLERFVRSSCRHLEPLEFTQRTRHVAGVLRQSLPDEIPEALRIVSASLPAELPDVEGMFSEHFWLWPLSDFVRDYAQEHWKEAMSTCYQLTRCFTSEFAIRPQLARHPEKTLSALQQWTSDESQHVRRLCSEGTRPRLPWASRLSLPRELVYPILDSLKADPSKFVQKSVANHLNDLGKDDSRWLLQTMKSWSRSEDPATQWIIRHALRSLIKQGDPAALRLIGYEPAKLKEVELTVKPDSIAIGESVSAQLKLLPSGRRAQPLLIDWIMHYARDSGRTSTKVFKGKEVVLPANEALEWEKKFEMKPRSIRTLHAGRHRLEVQINGKVVAETAFELRD